METTNETTRADREAAAHFYLKTEGVDGLLQDWIDGVDDDALGEVDPDVRDLAKLLAKVRRADAETARKAADYDRLATENEALRRANDTSVGSYKQMTSLLDSINAEHERLPTLDNGATRETEAQSRIYSAWQAALIGARLASAKEQATLMAENERLTRERDEARAEAAAWKRDFDAELSGAAALREKHGAQPSETMFDFVARMERERDAAEARAEALAAALREVTEIVVDCRRDVALTYSDGIIGDAIARAEAALAATPPADLTQKPCPCGGEGCEGTSDGLRHQCGGPAEACCVPGCGECGGTADLTQHPAYRAGVEAGIEEAAKVCDARRNAHHDAGDDAPPGFGRDLSHEISFESARCAHAIRALLDTKEVRDGE